jgi:large subunit ribosomal protein L14
MQGISSSITRALPIGAKLVCADNTGAKIVKIICVLGYKGRRRRIGSAGVGNFIEVTVKSGKYELKHQVLKAIIIRQKKEYRRANGIRIKFADNACVLIDDDKKPKGTEIKGPVAKEAIERCPKIGANAKIVV